MRLSVSVNGTNSTIASVFGPGYLSATVKMRERPKDNDYGSQVLIGGFETGETETVHLAWPTLDLNVNDVVEVKIMPDGEGDVPAEVRTSSESPSNLLTSTELAKELLEVVSEFEKRIDELSAKAHKKEPPEEYRKLGLAIATVAWEIGQNFLHPIYRRHKQLMPDELKGEIL